MYIVSRFSGKLQQNITGLVFCPNDLDPEYLKYLSWLKKDNQPEYVDFLQGELEEFNRSFLPKVVSQRQLRTQLVLNAFDLNDVQLAINDLSEPNKSVAQIAWDYAITFERDSPLLMCLATNLGLTVDEVDAIFLNASKL